MNRATQTLVPLMLAQERDHALVLLDDRMRIVGWHMAAAQIFGYEAEEILGKAMDGLFVPEDRERGEPELEVAIATRVGKAEDDRWSLRKDGSRFWANGILTCLRNDAGDVVGYSKIIRNRTDLRAQLDNLQNRITASEEGDEIRSLSIATLAHELRNPLGVLKNVTQILKLTTTEVAKLAEPLRTMDRQIDFIQRLVNDLFENARLDHGKVQLTLADESLRPIVEAAIETCSELLARAGQRVEMLFPAGEIVLSAEAERLKQAFVNLLSNASKFSPPDVVIWVKATVEGDEAVIRIEDPGKGIPKDLLPTIFDLFTQVAPFDASVPTGLGLGLTLVKKIVELHGGTIQARSEGVGLGSEFIVHLPLRPRRDASSKAVNDRPPPAAS